MISSFGDNQKIKIKQNGFKKKVLNIGDKQNSPQPIGLFKKKSDQEKPIFQKSINNLQKIRIENNEKQIIPSCSAFKIKLIKIESPKYIDNNYNEQRQNNLDSRLEQIRKQKQVCFSNGIQKSFKSIQALLGIKQFYIMLKKQISFDRDLTRWKNLVINQNKQTIIQLAIAKNIQKSELQISFQQFDPFLLTKAYKYSPQLIFKELAYCLNQSKAHWKLFERKFSQQAISQIYTRMDFDHKDHIDVFDFVRQVSINLKQSFKVKDLYLTMCRLSQNNKQLRFRQMRQYLTGNTLNRNY